MRLARLDGGIARADDLAVERQPGLALQEHEIAGPIALRIRPDRVQRLPGSPLRRSNVFWTIGAPPRGRPGPGSRLRLAHF